MLLSKSTLVAIVLLFITTIVFADNIPDASSPINTTHTSGLVKKNNYRENVTGSRQQGSEQQFGIHVHKGMKGSHYNYHQSSFNNTGSRQQGSAQQFGNSAVAKDIAKGSHYNYHQPSFNNTGSRQQGSNQQFNHPTVNKNARGRHYDYDQENQNDTGSRQQGSNQQLPTQ
jgi:hypothetical protein